MKYKWKYVTVNYKFNKGKNMTADEKRDTIAQEYINRLEKLYNKAIFQQPTFWGTKPPLLNLATQIAAELRRAKASLVTAKEQRELVESNKQMTGLGAAAVAEQENMIENIGYEGSHSVNGDD
jgi:hypothetical protein